MEKRMAIDGFAGSGFWVPDGVIAVGSSFNSQWLVGVELLVFSFPGMLFISGHLFWESMVFLHTHRQKSPGLFRAGALGRDITWGSSKLINASLLDRIGRPYQS
jgi:hypothetical protein